MKDYYLSKFFFNLIAVCLFVCLTVFSLQAQSDSKVVVTAPGSVAGDYCSLQAVFGPGLTAEVSGPVVEVVDTSGATTACFITTQDLSNSIALIDRGGCAFVTKAQTAQAAGAIGVIVCNSNAAVPTQAIAMGGDDMGTVTIPSVMIPYAQCQTIRAELGNGLTATLSPDGCPSEEGEVCDMAIEIGPGTHTVDTVASGYGAVFAGAANAVWYSYTPAANTLVTIRSCGLTDVDTRLYVLGGVDCDLANLIVVANNDDCADDNFASEVAFAGVGGTRYFVYWDDPWSNQGFDFEIVESAPPAVNISVSVNMDNETVSADGVWVRYASDINNQTDLQMVDGDGDGTYEGVLPLTTFDTIGYYFTNGLPADLANWEMVPEDCGVATPIPGLFIRPLIVTTISDITLATVCFSQCGNCEVTDCGAPRMIIDDDFESYELGAIAPQAEHWNTWSFDPGGPEDGEVSDEQALSGTKSMKITEDDPDDVLLLLGDQTEGHFVLQWNMYVPSGSAGYYNFQKIESTPGTWGMELFFNVDGTTSLNAGSTDTTQFTFQHDTWFRVIHVINLDEDYIKLIVDDRSVFTWPINWIATDVTGAKQLGSIDFFGGTDDFYYVDDIQFFEIPAAEEGKYCYTAKEITAPGVQTVPGVDCFGGGYDLKNDNLDGMQGHWFKYTATEDGHISISSCDGGADTRGWIFEGDCYNKGTLGVNDDRCDIGDGNNWASYNEAAVTAGNTYFILWDNIWESTGFDFEMNFTAGALTEAAFCQSAMAVAANTQIDVAEYVGEAPYAGTNVGTNQTNFPTGYTGSNWYSYTPDQDGFITIESCDLTTADTRVFLYDGECGSFESINLIATSDDDCDSQSLIAGEPGTPGVPVTAGTTYYIEWADHWDPSAFSFIVNFFQAVNITFKVDMSEVPTIHILGVRLVGDFTDEIVLLDEDNDMVYDTTFTLNSNSTYTYRFKNGPTAGGLEEINTSQGDDCTNADGDRTITVGTDNLDLPAVCFEWCILCDEIVAIDEVGLESGVSIFPNPSTDVLNIRFDFTENADNLQVRMLNMLGQSVYSKRLGTLQADMLEVDVSKFPAGTYMIQITDGEAQFTQQVVVE